MADKRYLNIKGFAKALGVDADVAEMLLDDYFGNEKGVLFDTYNALAKVYSIINVVKDYNTTPEMVTKIIINFQKIKKL